MVPRVKSTVLSERQFCPHPHPVGCLAISEDIFVLLVSSGQRPGVLPNIPQCAGLSCNKELSSPKCQQGQAKNPVGNIPPHQVSALKEVCPRCFGSKSEGPAVSQSLWEGFWSKGTFELGFGG